MTVLRWHGVVEDDVWKMDSHDHAYDINGGPTIGGVDVARLVDENFRLREQVTVTVDAGLVPGGIEILQGEISVWTGSRGIDEFNPAEPSSLMLGAFDLRVLLGRHDGQTVTLWLANHALDFGEYGTPKVSGVEILEPPVESTDSPIVVLGQLVEPGVVEFTFPISGQAPKLARIGESITIKIGPAVMEARRPGGFVVDGPPSS